MRWENLDFSVLLYKPQFNNLEDILLSYYYYIKYINRIHKKRA